MRRYDDPVETRMGQVSGTDGPEQFLWRGRLWKVRAVLAHWVETGPWWQSTGARAAIGYSSPPLATPMKRCATRKRTSGWVSTRASWKISRAARGERRWGRRMEMVDIERLLLP